MDASRSASWRSRPLGLSLGDRDAATGARATWFLLPVACVAGYLSFGNMLGDVWMFGQRFAVPALITSVPLLRMPRGPRGWLVTALALVVAVGSTVNVCEHFIKFEREEVGDLDQAHRRRCSRASTSRASSTTRARW